MSPLLLALGQGRLGPYLAEERGREGPMLGTACLQTQDKQSLVRLVSLQGHGNPWVCGALLLVAAGQADTFPLPGRGIGVYPHLLDPTGSP